MSRLLLAPRLPLLAVFLSRLFRRFSSSAVDWIEPEDLRRRMQAGAAPTMLDVRGPDEIATAFGHIPGALNIPLGELDGRLDELRSKANGAIAIVCRTDRRSATAQATLRAAGFDDVIVLRGGMERWAALGFEAVRDGGALASTTAMERQT
jgi:rhodanese-related sulfurtransferase